MKPGRFYVCCCVAALTLSLPCVTQPQSAEAQGFSSWFGGGGAQPGTPEWWEANKGKVQFTPGKGYSVPGHEGYFDKEGRPINAPVDEVTRVFEDDEPSVGILPDELNPVSNFQRAKVAIGRGPDEQAARQALAEGERLYAEKNYSAAARKFKTAIDRLPDSALAGRAQFLLAETYFYRDRYADARDAYDELLNNQRAAKDLNAVIERMWAIAQYWEKHHFEYKPQATLRPNFFDKTRPTFDTVGNAVKAYDSIRLNDPTGPRADDAIMATAEIYRRRGRFVEAAYHYNLLRTEYPRSKHQFDAHVLGLQAILGTYRGPDYDGTPLEEAQALLKQITTQFAGRLTPEEKERLGRVRAELQAAVEGRQLRLAQYYDKTGHYGSATQIYAQIDSDYSGSPIANQARERLAQLGGEPSEPPTRLAWFVDLFPQNSERSRVANVAELPATGGATRLAETPQNGGVTPASATTTR